MASQTTVTLTDDIDGKKADETVAFSLDGVNYEIDLHKKNAANLRKAFEEYIRVARTVRPVSPFRATRASRTRVPAAVKQEHRGDLAAIREWAKGANVAVADRGRIAQEVRDQYEAAKAAIGA